MLRLPEGAKQAALTGFAVIAVLLPQALPVLLGLVLLSQFAEALTIGGRGAVLALGAWGKLRPALLLFLLPILALALLPWSEWPGLSAGRAVRLIGEILLALALAGIVLAVPPGLAARRARAVIIGVSVGAGLALADLASHGLVTGFLRGQPVDAITYGRSAVLAALVVVPTLLAAPLPLVQRAMLVMPGVILAALSANLAAKLLLPVAAIAALIGVWRWGAVLVALVVSSAIALPALLPVGLTPAQECALWAAKPSAAHRLLIWTYADGLINQRPWSGWGLDAARRLGAVAPDAPVPDCARPGLGRDTVPLLPLHPHNGALQLWLELGAVGAGLLLLLLFRMAVPLSTVSSRTRMVGSAALAGSAVPLLVSFGLWQGWWLAGLSVFWGLILLYFTPRS